MKIEAFGKNWQFRKVGAPAWEDVSIPHDAVIGTTRRSDVPNGTRKAFFENGSWEYRKVFFAPEEWEEGKTELLFEGVMSHAAVFCNGNFVCRHAYGYTHFFANLSPYLVYGAPNVVCVTCKTGDDSRWYTGGGIYRDVWLCTGKADSLPVFGVRVTTLSADEDSALLRIEVDSPYPFSASVESEGKPVARCCGTRSAQVKVDRPRLWSDETPFLYTCRVKAAGEEKIVSFGIRTIAVSPERGLLVNGRRVSLRGGCIHHDSTFLGARTFSDYEERRIRLLKEAGFNAVRMAHHPASRCLLDACDKYGVYVMDEFADVWEASKTPDDYSNDFEDSFEGDIAAMTEKDHNHPSVILYSIGNEITDLAFPRGVETARRLAEEVKKRDGSRLTTVAMNGILHLMELTRIRDVLSGEQEDGGKGDVNEQLNALTDVAGEVCNHPRMDKTIAGGASAVDVAGYNYMSARYLPDEEKCPERVIVGSETYAKDIAPMWDHITSHTNVIGDFVWTAWDYLGETGLGLTTYRPRSFYAPYPCISAACGDLDLAGDRLPQSYYREIVYGLRKAPYVAVHVPAHRGERAYLSAWGWDDVISSWAFSVPEGTMLTVDVYGEGEVELFLNGENLGRKECGKRRKATYSVPYRRGELRAVGNGESYSLLSAGKERLFAAKAERYGDLTFVSLSVTDEHGTILPEEEPLVELEAEGCELLGFGSAVPLTEECYTDAVHTLFRGRGLAIVRGGVGGRLFIRSAGFKNAEISL